MEKQNFGAQEAQRSVTDKFDTIPHEQIADILETTGFGRGKRISDSIELSINVERDKSFQEVFSRIYEGASPQEMWLIVRNDLRAADTAQFCLELQNPGEPIGDLAQRHHLNEVVSGFDPNLLENPSALRLFGVGLSQLEITPRLQERLLGGMPGEVKIILSAILMQKAAPTGLTADRSDYYDWMLSRSRRLESLPELFSLTPELLQKAHSIFLQDPAEKRHSLLRSYGHLICTVILSNAELTEKYQQTYGERWLEVIGDENFLAVCASDALTGVLHNGKSQLWDRLNNTFPNLDDYFGPEDIRRRSLAYYQDTPKQPAEALMSYVSPAEIARFACERLISEMDNPYRDVSDYTNAAGMAKEMQKHPAPFFFYQQKKLVELILETAKQDSTEYIFAFAGQAQMARIDDELHYLMGRLGNNLSGYGYVVTDEMFRISANWPQGPGEDERLENFWTNFYSNRERLRADADRLKARIKAILDDRPDLAIKFGDELLPKAPELG